MSCLHGGAGPSFKEELMSFTIWGKLGVDFLLLHIKWSPLRCLGIYLGCLVWLPLEVFLALCKGWMT